MKFILDWSVGLKRRTGARRKRGGDVEVPYRCRSLKSERSKHVIRPKAISI